MVFNESRLSIHTISEPGLKMLVCVCLCLSLSLQHVLFLLSHVPPLCFCSWLSPHTDHHKPKKSGSFESNHIQLSTWGRPGPGGPSGRTSWMGNTAGVKPGGYSGPRKLLSQPGPDKVSRDRHRQTYHQVNILTL